MIFVIKVIGFITIVFFTNLIGYFSLRYIWGAKHKEAIIYLVVADIVGFIAYMLDYFSVPIFW